MAQSMSFRHDSDLQLAAGKVEPPAGWDVLRFYQAPKYFEFPI